LLPHFTDRLTELAEFSLGASFKAGVLPQIYIPFSRVMVLLLPLFATLSCLSSTVVARPTGLDIRANNKPAPVGFAADPSINAKGILAAAQASTAKGNDILATFAAASGPEVHIFGDWLNLNGVSAFHWISDMQVDCDGPDVSDFPDI
jgi:hypothetical protein